MREKLKRSVAYIFVVLVGLFLISEYVVRRNVPFFDTSDWIYEPTLNDGLLLRRESEGSGALLIKNVTNDKLIKRYDSSTNKLENVTGDVWNQATGPIVRCRSLSAHALSGAEKQVSTKGTSVRNITESPGKTKVAILSATGIKSFGSLSPFGGSSGVIGPHWHQVYSVEKHEMEPGATRLPIPFEFADFDGCWSADEQFVVYYDMGLFYLSIIPIN